MIGVAPANRRDSVLYVNVKKQNKRWAELEAKRLGYSSLSSYVDAALDTVRKKQSASKARAAKKRTRKA